MHIKKSFGITIFGLVTASFVLVCAYLFTNVFAAGTDGQNAESTIGQMDSAGVASFVSGTVNDPINKGIDQPYGSVLDATNHLFYIADKNNNRVLAYSLNTNNTFPDYLADFVVGQADFQSVSTNRGSGSPANNSLSGPRAVAIDSAGKLYIADSNNNRVMIFDKVVASDPTALNVIGAANFTSTNSARTVSNKRMITPSGIAFTGTVGSNLTIYIADIDANRVLIYSEITGDDQMASKVLGQTDFVSSGLGTSNVGLGSPNGLAVDSGGADLYVADKANNRIMIWDLPISEDGQAANLVLGQTWFNSNSSGTTSSQFNQPTGVAVNTNSEVFVADAANNRVMVFSSAIVNNGQAADKVLGQSDFTSSSSGISSTKFSGPQGISSSNGTTVFISDTNNNRIIAYTSLISSNGQAANFVVGQTNQANQSYFYGNAPNNPVNRGLNSPSALTFDRANHRLFVVDSGNNRILGYNLNTDDTLPDGTADLVLGQQDFSRTTANSGLSVNASTLNAPSGVFYDNINGRLYIADTGNNRVMIWQSSSIVTGHSADYVLGQTTMTDSVPGVSSVQIASPVSVSVNTTTGAIAIADRDNNRVLIWTTPVTTNGQAANWVIGQSDFNSSDYGLTASNFRTPKGVSYDINRNYLYVADADNNRVLIWTAPIASNGQGANFVLGQTNFTSSNLATTASGLKYPTRVYASPVSNAVYIADTNNNRILIFTEDIAGNGQAANRVLGQADMTSSSAATTQAGLNKPSQAVVNPTNGKVFVADTSNNRLVYYQDTDPVSPTLVSPPDAQTGISAMPSLLATTNDPDGDALQYKIQVATDAAFTEDVQTFDQTSSSTGWTGQNFGNAYFSGSNSSYNLSLAQSLISNQTYYWRAYAYDLYGNKTWSASPSATRSFTTAPPYKVAFLTAPFSQAAGAVSSAVTVQLQDANSNPCTAPSNLNVYLTSNSGNGSFSLSSSPFTPLGSPPNNYVTIPAGSTSTIFYYKDTTIGSPTLTASDASPPNGNTGLHDATLTIAVTSATVDHFTWTTITSQNAGVHFQITVSAKDVYNNTVTDFSTPCDLSSTPAGVSPGTISFVAGLFQGNVTVTHAQSTSLTVTYTSINSSSNSFSVAAGALSSTTISPASFSAKAGSDNSLTALPADIYGNYISSGVVYAWTVSGGIGTLSSSSTNPTTLTAAGVIASGTADLTVTQGALNATASINVQNIPDHYAFSSITSPQIAGTGFSLTVDAKTLSGTTISNFNGSVALSDTTASISPTSVTLTSGTWTGNVTILTTAANDLITATSHAGAVVSNSGTFNVSANVLDHVASPTTSFVINVNTTQQLAANAYDLYNNAISGLTYNWSTSIGSVPSTGNPVTYSAGTTSGTGFVTISVTQGAITKNFDIGATVNSLVPTSVTFDTINQQQAGVAFVIVIRARDVYGNAANSYTGHGALSSAAGAISPSSTSNFVNGVWSGSVIMTNATASTSISYTDSPLAGNSNTFAILPNSLDHISLDPTSASIAVLGTQNFTAIAYDQYDNVIASGFSITWSAVNGKGTVSPASGSLTTTFTAGTEATTETLTVIITEGVVAKTSQATIVINSSALNHFQISQINSPQVVNSSIYVSFTALDLYQNVVRSFEDTVTISDLSGNALPTVSGHFSNGTWDGIIRISSTYTSDSLTICAGQICNNSNSFDVISNLIDHVYVTPTSSTIVAGQTQGFSAQAYDAYGNIVTGAQYSWEVISGIGDVSPTVAISTTFTARQTVGTGWVRVVATQGAITKTCDATVTVVPGSLDRVVFPIITDKVAGVTFSLTLLAADSYGNTITSFSGNVNLNDGYSGIQPSTIGPFVSGAWSGSVVLNHAGTIRISATYGAIVTQSDVIQVSPSSLSQIVMSEDPFNISAGLSKTLTAVGQDRFANPITSGVAFTWGVSSNVGAYTVESASSIMVTAAENTATGIISINAVSDQNSVQKTLTANVIAGDIAKFSFSDISSPQIVGSKFQITMIAQDQFNNTVNSFNSVAQLSDTTMTISPSQTTPFVNGVWSGSATITRVEIACAITALSGAISDSSNTFSVTASNNLLYLNIVSGNNQTAAAGTLVPTDLAVQVVDQYSNPIQGQQVNYSVVSFPSDSIGQTMTVSTELTDANGNAASKLTLGSKVGMYVVSASLAEKSSAQVNFYATAQTGPVASLELSPKNTIILINNSQQYSIRGFDSYGNLVDLKDLAWKIVSGGGQVDQNGLFTAGESTGVFDNTIEVTSGAARANATVTVTTLPGLTKDNRPNAGELDHIFIAPSNPSIEIAGTTAISVTAYDKYNESLKDISFEWSMESQAGSLTPKDANQTTIVAGNTPTSGKVTVVATQSSTHLTKSESTTVTVVPSKNGYLDFVLPEEGIASSKDFTLSIIARTGSGEINKGFNGPVQISDTSGSISPAITGTFSDGIWQGQLALDTGLDKTIILASGGGLIGSSKSIDLKNSSGSSTGGFLGTVRGLIEKTGTNLAGLVHSFLKTSAQFPDATKNVASGLVAAVGFLAAGIGFGLIAARGIEALGRNPYAKWKIISSILVSFVVCLIFGAFAFIIAAVIKFF